jgi:hypothetical protein
LIEYIEELITWMWQLWLDAVGIAILVALGLVGDARRDWAALRRSGCV